MVISVLMIILGFIFLIVGADLLVDGSRDIARKFHIPEIVIGLTIVSIGTSMPELFVSVTSAFKKSPDMAIGNVIGSNLSNLLLILGLSTMIKPVKFQRETRLIEIPMCLAITVILAIFCNTSSIISRFEAGVLMFLFVCFIGYTIYMSKNGSDFDKEDDDSDDDGLVLNINIFKSIIFIVIGIIGLKFGGDFVVENAKIIASKLGISEKLISLTIVAIGTSLPELVTSVTAALKGDSDIAIGNIIGSNIFNILLILGVSSMIVPIAYNISYNLDMIILIVSTILLSIFPLIKPKNQMSRMNGLIYFLMYIAYMIFSIVR